jgi:hypothetical protein
VRFFVARTDIMIQVYSSGGGYEKRVDARGRYSLADVSPQREREELAEPSGDLSPRLSLAAFSSDASTPRMQEQMLYYKVTGDAAAVSLLNRLSALGQSAKTIRGRLAALTPISLTAEAKKRAQIPPKASFYAFAYPLDCMAADTATLLQAVIGSVSRLDDESFFFFLLGGFCYFDERKQFLQANAISLSRRFSVIEHGEEVMVSSGELVFDGPYALGDNVADALRAADRFAAWSVAALKDAGLLTVAWVNPSERPGGLALHETVTWQSGAFVCERADGSAVFYRTIRGPQSTSATERSRHWAPGWAREHAGFDKLNTRFEDELEKSRRLRESIRTRKRGDVEKWCRKHGWIMVLYYVVGCLLFNHIEGYDIITCIYHITQTVLTIGYGDFAPPSWQGRLLSIFYMPIGTVIVVGGVYPPTKAVLSYLDQFNASLMNACASIANKCRLACAGRLTYWFPHSSFAASLAASVRPLASSVGAAPSAAPGPESSGSRELRGQHFTVRALRGIRREVGPLYAYIHAFLQPFIVILVYAIATAYLYTCRQGYTDAEGILENGRCDGIQDFPFLNALYQCVVTMTTVGYGDGDLVPRTDNEKIYFIFFFLITVTTLTVAIERVRLLWTSRRIFFQDYGAELPLMMRREAIKERKLDPIFSEDEFVLLVLQQYGVVDSDLIKSIRQDFKRLESFGLGGHIHAGNGEIEVLTLFEHLVARGHIVDSNRKELGTGVLEEAFSTFDKNGDGTIDIKELGTGVPRRAAPGTRRAAPGARHPARGTHIRARPRPRVPAPAPALAPALPTCPPALPRCALVHTLTTLPFSATARSHAHARPANDRR